MNEKRASNDCRSDEFVGCKMEKQSAYSWNGIRDLLTFLLLVTSATSVILVISLSRRMHEIESKVERELIQSRLSSDHLGSEYNKLSLLLTDAEDVDKTGRRIFDPVSRATIFLYFFVKM